MVSYICCYETETKGKRFHRSTCNQNHSRTHSYTEGEIKDRKKKVRKERKQEKLKPGASSPGAKQYGDRQNDQPTDEVFYRGAILAPKKSIRLY